MTPQEFKEARYKLGISLAQMAPMLGYDGAHASTQIRKMETGDRTIRDAQARLVQAYLDGYRPNDWPLMPH